jgi:hypothetical protein
MDQIQSPDSVKEPNPRGGLNEDEPPFAFEESVLIHRKTQVTRRRVHPDQFP